MGFLGKRDQALEFLFLTKGRKINYLPLGIRFLVTGSSWTTTYPTSKGTHWTNNTGNQCHVSKKPCVVATHLFAPLGSAQLPVWDPCCLLTRTSSQEGSHHRVIMYRSWKGPQRSFSPTFSSQRWGNEIYALNGMPNTVHFCQTLDWKYIPTSSLEFFYAKDKAQSSSMENSLEMQILSLCPRPTGLVEALQRNRTNQGSVGGGGAARARVCVYVCVYVHVCRLILRNWLIQLWEATNLNSIRKANWLETGEGFLCYSLEARYLLLQETSLFFFFFF